MQQSEADAARRALYAPHPAPDAVARYLDLAGPEESAPQPAPGPPVQRARLPRPVALKLAAGLLGAAVVVGLLLAPALRHDIRSPAPQPKEATEHFQQSVAGDDALMVFDRPASTVDVSRAASAMLAVPDLRWLVTLGSSSLYAARSSDGILCLALTQPDGHVTATCAEAEVFRRSGVALSLASVPRSAVGGALRATWLPDGRVEWWDGSS